MGFLDFFKISSSTQVIHGERIINIFDSTIAGKGTASGAIKELKALGISYRRKSMLDDYRRYEAIARIKDRTPDKLSKVFNYYDKVVEPFRKANNLTGKQAWAVIHEWKKGEFETIDRAKEVKAFNIEFKFCRTPPCEGDIDEQDKV